MSRSAETITPAATEYETDIDRALSLAVALLGAMFLVVRPTSQFASYSVEAAVAGMASLLFMLVTGLRTWLNRPSAFAPERLMLVALMWIGIFLWGMLRSPNYGAALPQAADATIYIAMAIAGFFIARQDPALVNLFTRAVIAMVVVEALNGIWQRFVDLPFLQQQVHEGKQALPGMLQSTIGVYRLEGNDVFGTFGNPNSLAAYLVMGFWLLAGMFPVSKLKRIIAATAAVSIIVALVFTNSKGGAVACIAGAWFFAVQRISSKNTSLGSIFKKLTIAGVLALLAILALGFFGKIPMPLSMQVRFEYWRAALGMIQARPWDGVGLAGYAETYTYFKTPLGTESKEAHNDYVHLLSELGVLGPMIYLATFALLFRIFSRRAENENKTVLSAPTQSKHEKLVIGGGFLGFALMYFSFHPFNSYEILRVFSDFSSYSALSAIFALAMPLVFVVIIRALKSDNEKSWSSGLKAAIGAILLHQLVDFDFKAQAVMTALFLLAGMYYAIQTRGIAQEKAPSLLEISSRYLLPGLAVLLFPIAVWIPMTSGIAREDAESIEQEIQELSARPVAPGGENVRDKRYRELRNSLVEVRLEAAQRASFDGNAWLELASAYQNVLRQYHQMDLEKPILSAIDQGEKLRPLAAYPKVLRGDFYFYRGSERVLHKISGDEDFRNAYLAYKAAAARYPLAPGLKLDVGDALLMLGKAPEAAAAYDESFQTDIRIFDHNVRLSAVFDDPLPGAMPKHGNERVLFEAFNRYVMRAEFFTQEKPSVRRGLLLRRAFTITALLRENERTHSMKPNVESAMKYELIGTMQAVIEACETLQEKAHAAWLKAFSYEVVGKDLAAEKEKAWQIARDLQKQSVEAGTPGTPPALFKFFETTNGGIPQR